MKTYCLRTVKSADVDSSNRIRMADLVDHLISAGEESLQDTPLSNSSLRSVFHAEWLMTRVKMMAYEIPQCGTEMEIETWIEKQDDSNVYRNFTVRMDKDGEKSVVARMSSVWTIVDADSGKIAEAPFAEAGLWRGVCTPGSLHIPHMPMKGFSEANREQHRRVAYSDVATRNYLSGSRCIAYMYDVCPELSQKTPLWLEISYKEAIRRNDEAVVRFCYREEELECEIRSHKDELVCSAVFTTF